jgi:hypothetical protein
MSWFDVPEADRLEQEQDADVTAGYDDEGSEVEFASRPVPLEAPIEDVVEQRQVVRQDDWDDPRA